MWGANAADIKVIWVSGEGKSSCRRQITCRQKRKEEFASDRGPTRPGRWLSHRYKNLQQFARAFRERAKHLRYCRDCRTLVRAFKALKICNWGLQ
jgi:hypothetical protein